MLTRTALLLLCALTTVSACSNLQKEPYQLPEHAERLLAGDSAKVWKLARRYNGATRMNMGDCFLSYQATYSVDHTMHDNNGEQRDCGPTLRATWEFTEGENGRSYIKVSSEQLPELMGIEEDHKFFQVLLLSEGEMRLRFKHKQFHKERWMTDIYVPDSADVEGREFHW